MIAAIGKLVGEGGWLRRDIAVTCMTVVAGILTFAAAIAWLAQPHLEASLATADITTDGGFAYIAPISRLAPPGYVFVGDGMGKGVSNLQLRENGQSLGPAHAGHPDIRETGKGRYSHWRTRLWFSASDSTDPRTNGRTYTISARASLHPFVLPAVALFDLLVLFAAWRRLISDPPFRRRAANAAMIASLALAALVAAGVFGRVAENSATPKDAALVIAALLHALFGCLILIAQWTAGAGVARLVLGARYATVPNVLLLGFALSLPLVAVFAVAALSLPYGFGLGMAAWAVCCLPLRAWRPAAGELAGVARAAIAVLPFALGFGCWMALHWHGPTETLGGSPSGDLTYYSTSIASFSKQLYPYLNLGYEYEPLGLYFNMLFPMVGAAFSRVAPLDPFLFITASGAASFVLALGLTLYLYIRGTGVLSRGRHAGLASLTLALAIIVGNRYPYWVVESIPMIHAVSLTIAVVYWARKNDARARLLAFALAVVGSALSKVVGAAVLAPFVAATALPRFFQMSRRVRLVAIVAAVVAAAYAGYLLYRVGANNFGVAPLGPASVNLMLRYHADVWTALPFVLRDVSAVLLAVVAFLLLDWLVASAIALGFVLFLVYPFVLLFDYVCATIVLGLIACDRPARLWKHRYLVIGALLLSLPAVLLTDPGGISNGFAWLVCIGGVIWIAMSGERALTWRGAWTGPGRAAAAAAVLLCLGLAAVGRGHLIPDSRWQPGVLTPQVRQIWLAVKERTPPDALIFTDQTGIEATLLGSWNTYAFIGERQIFVSNLYMNSATRLNRELSLAVLRENDAVLNGKLPPSQLKLRGQYSSYFAVVSRTRTVPAEWVRIFENDGYALYRLSANR
jgi:hypothetical protein